MAHDDKDERIEGMTPEDFDKVAAIYNDAEAKAFEAFGPMAELGQAKYDQRSQAMSYDFTVQWLDGVREERLCDVAFKGILKTLQECHE